MTRQRFAGLIKIAAALTLPAALAACGTTDRIKTSSIPMEDYTARHPIAIMDTASSVDVFPSMAQGRLDRHTAKQIYGFVEQYRDTGHGPILILLPRGRAEGPHGALLAEIRRLMTAAGAHGGIEVSTYPITDPNLASPIRLSFKGMKAQVADQCGQWPNDLASGSSVEGWENKTYWNFGCATQSMIAAQVSDPRDLVAPRGDEPADTQIRERGIGSIRGGSDPNTGWQVKNTNIGGIGGS